MTLEGEVDWLRRAAGVLVLNDRAVIAVSGDDARDWLQGQITNQLEGLQAESSLYAFVLTLRGRVLADVWVLARKEDVWLDVPKRRVDALLERFDRYIIMEDVDLEYREDLRIIAAQGPKAAELADGGWPADRLGSGGRQWVVGEAELDTELDRLASRAVALGGGKVGESTWAHAHVLFGRPRFGVDFGEHTYPQETGLTSVAVSFQKGCYIGQETVMMLEKRGKAPKVLWRWELDAPDPPPAETPIMAGGSRVGEVTSAVAHENRTLALGYLKRGHQADDSAGFTIAGASATPLGKVEDGPGLGRSGDDR